MTKEEFENIGVKSKTDQIVNLILCFLIIMLSIFFQIKFYSLFNLNLSKINLLIVILLYIVFLFLLALGCYGIFGLLNPIKISYWKNEITEVENSNRIKELCTKLNGKNFLNRENFIQFDYKKSYWSYTHQIYFWIENNLISVNTKIIDRNPKGGFLDFGARFRLHKKLNSFLNNKASW
jgi:energy-coupling factor transporter transmembrane protein EcfT